MNKLEYAVAVSKVREAVEEIRKAGLEEGDFYGQLVDQLEYVAMKDENDGASHALYLVRDGDEAVMLEVDNMAWTAKVELSANWTGRKDYGMIDASIDDVLEAWKREAKRLIEKKKKRKEKK